MKNFILLILICYLSTSCLTDFDRYKIGLDYFDNQEYNNAKRNFKNVDSSDLNFSKAQKYLIKIDSIETEIEKEKVKQLILEYKEDAKTLLISLKERAKINNAPGSLVAIDVEILLFESWVSDINIYKKSKDKDLNKAAIKLKSTLIKLQIKRFPKLRKSYTKFINDALWENDITAHNSNYNTTINFTGGVFAANINIKDFESEIESTLIKLRFKKSKYRWYEGADKFTYYSLEPKKDSKL